MKLLAGCLVMVALTVVSAGAEIEIAYDDGTAERGIVWNEAGNGVAERFSVDPDCMLIAAKFFTVATYFCNPLGICVLDANGPEGAPGDTLCGYFVVPLEPYYQEVTFPEPIALPGPDFYVVYLQTGWGNADSNLFGIDTSSPPDGRSWLYENGVWSLMALEEGGVMIRAIFAPATPTVPHTWGGIKGEYQ